MPHITRVSGNQQAVKAKPTRFARNKPQPFIPFGNNAQPTSDPIAGFDINGITQNIDNLIGSFNSLSIPDQGIPGLDPNLLNDLNLDPSLQPAAQQGLQGISEGIDFNRGLLNQGLGQIGNTKSDISNLVLSILGPAAQQFNTNNDRLTGLFDKFQNQIPLDPFSQELTDLQTRQIQDQIQVQSQKEVDALKESFARRGLIGSSQAIRQEFDIRNQAASDKINTQVAIGLNRENQNQRAREIRSGILSQLGQGIEGLGNQNTAVLGGIVNQLANQIVGLSGQETALLQSGQLDPAILADFTANLTQANLGIENQRALQALAEEAAKQNNPNFLQTLGQIVNAAFPGTGGGIANIAGDFFGNQAPDFNPLRGAFNGL